MARRIENLGLCHSAFTIYIYYALPTVFAAQVQALEDEISRLDSAMDTAKTANKDKISALESGHLQDKVDTILVDHLKSTLERSMKTQWTFDESFARVVSASEQIKGDERQVICLDLEFSPVSQLPFEIGICDYYSGETLMDIKVKHQVSEGDLHRPAIAPRSD